MTLTKSDVDGLLEALRAGGDVDVIRKSVDMVLQVLIDAPATEVIGAERYERSTSRMNWRNGGRDRLLATKAGDVELRIPKLRKGSFVPVDPRASSDPLGAGSGAVTGLDDNPPGEGPSEAVPG